MWDFPGGLVAKNSGSQCSRPGLIPDPGVSSHVSQLRIWMLQLRILCATTLDLAQPNKNNLFLRGLGLRKNRSKPVFSPSSSSCPVRCRSLDPGWLFTLNILMNWNEIKWKIQLLSLTSHTYFKCLTAISVDKECVHHIPECSIGLPCGRQGASLLWTLSTSL